MSAEHTSYEKPSILQLVSFADEVDELHQYDVCSYNF